MEPGKDITPTKEPITRSMEPDEDVNATSSTSGSLTRSDVTPGAPTRLSRPPRQQRQDSDDEDEDEKEHYYEEGRQQTRLTLAQKFDRATWPHYESVSRRERIVLHKLKGYRDKYRNTSLKNEVADLSKRFEVLDMSRKDPVEVLTRRFQVVDMSPDEVILRIEKLMTEATRLGYYSVLSRKAKGSQIFSLKYNSWVLIRKKEFKRREAKGSVQYEITQDLLTRICKLCQKRKHMELREIYYTNTDEYKDKVAAAVDDVCCMIGCTRSSLFITASETGLIYGDISFTLDGTDFNCRSGGCRGISIPPNSSSITNIRSNHDDDDHLYFILVVEKGTVFKRLAEDGFCEKYHCIMITGKGMPGVETRIILRKISIELRLPVFALMDGNPYGLRIYSVYRYGSKKMSYDRDNLVTPDIQLLGIQYSDIYKFEVPAKHIEVMKEKDVAVARKLLERDHLEDYHHHLESMIENMEKVQIEALNCHDLEYSAEVAVPMMVDDQVTLLDVISMAEEKIQIGALSCDAPGFLEKHGFLAMVYFLCDRSK